MPSEDPKVQKWKRRERSLAIAIVLWIFLVGFAVILAPDATTDWIESSDGLTIVGVMLISVGILGGVVESGMAVFSAHLESDESENLTEWEEFDQ